MLRKRTQVQAQLTLEYVEWCSNKLIQEHWSSNRLTDKESARPTQLTPTANKNWPSKTHRARFWIKTLTFQSFLSSKCNKNNLTMLNSPKLKRLHRNITHQACSNLTTKPSTIHYTALPNSSKLSWKLLGMATILELVNNNAHRVTTDRWEKSRNVRKGIQMWEI